MRKLCHSEPNTLFFKAYISLISQGFKLLFRGFMHLTNQCPFETADYADLIMNLIYFNSFNPRNLWLKTESLSTARFRLSGPLHHHGKDSP
jgi:hypothetical protein